MLPTLFLFLSVPSQAAINCPVLLQALHEVVRERTFVTASSMALADKAQDLELAWGELLAIAHAKTGAPENGKTDFSCREKELFPCVQKELGIPGRFVVKFENGLPVRFTVAKGPELSSASIDKLIRNLHFFPYLELPEDTFFSNRLRPLALRIYSEIARANKELDRVLSHPGSAKSVELLVKGLDYYPEMAEGVTGRLTGPRRSKEIVEAFFNAANEEDSPSVSRFLIAMAQNWDFLSDGNGGIPEQGQFPFLDEEFKWRVQPPFEKVLVAIDRRARQGSQTNHLRHSAQEHVLLDIQECRLFSLHQLPPEMLARGVMERLMYRVGFSSTANGLREGLYKSLSVAGLKEILRTPFERSLEHQRLFSLLENFPPLRKEVMGDLLEYLVKKKGSKEFRKEIRRALEAFDPEDFARFFQDFEKSGISKDLLMRTWGKLMIYDPWKGGDYWNYY